MDGGGDMNGKLEAQVWFGTLVSSDSSFVVIGSGVECPKNHRPETRTDDSDWEEINYRRITELYDNNRSLGS